MTRLTMTLWLADSWPPDPSAESLFTRYPWAWNLVLFLLTLGLVAIMVWFARAGRTGNGFVIRVDEDDITFTGNFPPKMQATVSEFLRHDVALPGAYEIRAHWHDRMLVVVVKGEHALPMEQRIRNFLKLNLKPPGTYSI